MTACIEEAYGHYLYSILTYELALPHFYITSGRIECQADGLVIPLDIVDRKLSCGRGRTDNGRTVYRPEDKRHGQYQRHGPQKAPVPPQNGCKLVHRIYPPLDFGTSYVLSCRVMNRSCRNADMAATEKLI